MEEYKDVQMEVGIWPINHAIIIYKEASKKEFQSNKPIEISEKRNGIEMYENEYEFNTSQWS